MERNPRDGVGHTIWAGNILTQTLHLMFMNDTYITLMKFNARHVIVRKNDISNYSILWSYGEVKPEVKSEDGY